MVRLHGGYQGLLTRNSQHHIRRIHTPNLRRFRITHQRLNRTAKRLTSHQRRTILRHLRNNSIRYNQRAIIKTLQTISIIIQIRQQLTTAQITNRFINAANSRFISIRITLHTTTNLPSRRQRLIIITTIRRFINNLFSRPNSINKRITVTIISTHNNFLSRNRNIRRQRKRTFLASNRISRQALDLYTPMNLLKSIGFAGAINFSATRQSRSYESSYTI